MSDVDESELRALVEQWRERYNEYLEHERQNGVKYKECARQLEQVLQE